MFVRKTLCLGALLLLLTACAYGQSSSVREKRDDLISERIAKRGCTYAALLIENTANERIIIYSYSGTRNRLGDVSAYTGKDVFCIRVSDTNSLGDLVVYAEKPPRGRGPTAYITLPNIAGMVWLIMYHNLGFDQPSAIPIRTLFGEDPL